MKVTIVHTVDTHFVPPEVDTPYDPALSVELNIARRDHPDYHFELNIFSLDSFVMDHFPSPIAPADVVSSDTTLMPGHSTVPTKLDASVLTLRKEERADYFWVRHFAQASQDIVIGIYQTIFSLKEKGYKYWSFPNGEKVSRMTLTFDLES